MAINIRKDPLFCNAKVFYLNVLSYNLFELKLMFKKGKDFSHFELSISAIACEQRQQIIKNENDQNRGKEMEH